MITITLKIITGKFNYNWTKETWICQNYWFKFIIETEEKEIEVLIKLKETVDKQRDEVRKQKREISQKNVDCEAVGILKREIIYFCSFWIISSVLQALLMLGIVYCLYA